MSYNIRPTPTFQKQFRKLLKKYRSLTDDILILRRTLLEKPTQGTPLGKNCFKVRLAISSKNKGKSGGARIITHVQIVDDTVFLLSIYDKSTKSNLNEGELDTLLLEIDD
ncbi:type II toxin-antitoxin system RelE/ParE family toxin [Persicitalea jodogahamensis]|uniref:Uncharacterized protein n=1 Tax=Persicitalea jodogahamensis TaxID=402147 RepID=A0A8J3DD23_9BACT|nr:type II toxin-antitoxin system RelE/ParE family toxin [Persicitalea jodogahamensis]GHB78582.1 hypothetical protein GCM10007390_36140 [Persicitalea jodogahamensis]